MFLKIQSLLFSFVKFGGRGLMVLFLLTSYTFCLVRLENREKYFIEAVDGKKTAILSFIV